MKRAVIIGATSGIGREVAKQLLLQGWHLGIAGRRLPSLEALQSSAPDRVEVSAELRHRLSEHRAESGHRTGNHPYQCGRVHPYGGHCFQLLP